MPDNTKGLSKQQIADKAAELLRAAGTDEAAIAMITADAAASKAVVDRPESAAAIAQANPSAAAGQWGTLNAGFESETAPPPGMSMAGFSMPTAPPKGGYQVNEAGQVKFNNGVIYDPDTDTVVTPPNDSDAAGSAAWFLKIQDSWSPEKIQAEREKLLKYGYDVAAKGGFDQKFMTALREFHYARYRNFGRPLPVDQKERLTKADFGGTLDPAVLDAEVDMWFEEAYEDAPSEDERVFWRNKLRKSAMRIAQKQGLDPGSAVAVAQARVQGKFRDSPEVQDAMESAEQLEGNTAIRDRVVSISQLASI